MKLFSYSSPSSTSSSATTTTTSNPTFKFSPSHSQPRKPRSLKTPIKSLKSPASQPTLPPYTPPNNNINDRSTPVLKREDFGDLLIRRPVIEKDDDDPDEDGFDNDNDDEERRRKRREKSVFDESLEKFAKKIPIFEPGRGDQDQAGAPKRIPLKINLDLALYKAKVLTKNFKFLEAESILQQCIYYWPEDGRLYVAMGKVLRKQSKVSEAREIYAKGSQATQGENAYIWQCWAVLENEMGNIRKARELFDAATVADKKHVAAWHGWAVLEVKEGNIKKARNLLGKAIKYRGGNEYVYQTLALLEAKANRYEQAQYLFRQATKCNPKSCASWLAWAQLEMQQENNPAARYLFEKSVEASPKNRFAWHVWGLFEESIGYVDKARKLLKIGHLVNPRDPVLLQSLALLEYKHSTANISRVLFRRASEMDPRHQPVWIAWGWMEWKEGNIGTARELYQKALSINSTTESAARCLQAWGVLEQRVGNLSAARRLFTSSLNINSQSYITWMTWATMEENQGNSERAEEIRNLYYQQRIEVVDDASWVTGFMDIIDPALDRIKKMLNLEKQDSSDGTSEPKDDEEFTEIERPREGERLRIRFDFDLDGFVKRKLSLDPSKLDSQMEKSLTSIAETQEAKKPWRSR